MNRQIVINATSFETRVALIEGGVLSEYLLERTLERGIVGNIYKGKVVRVLAGMQSAFVDIGFDRAAFLYGGDILNPQDIQMFDDDIKPRHDERNIRIQDLVREGQEILVQVAKDEIGTKGARVTTYLSLPGRYVVLMPYIQHIGISRRISSETERNRLKNIASKLKPENCGIIVRTASEGVDDEKLIADIDFLVKIWEGIQQKNLVTPPCSLIHEDLDLVFRSSRDLMSQNIDRIVIDHPQKYHELVSFFNRFSVKLGAQVQLYEGETPIFDTYGIELDISKALQPKVWLKSGGYIIIQQTEALISIDVNTGRFVGHKSLDDTILRTNIESAKEIVQQLRLRNLGGIIIVDFIDMDRYEDREKVFQVLVEELKKDKAKTSVLKISEMGLVQMTRKRTEESLSHKLCQTCPVCQGRGEIKTTMSVCYEILHEIIREFASRKVKVFSITAHPNVIDRFHEEDAPFVEALKQKYDKNLILKSDASYSFEQYEITGVHEALGVGFKKS